MPGIDIQAFLPIAAHLEKMAVDSDLLRQAEAENEWFTANFVRQAIQACLPWFKEAALQKFAAKYVAPAKQKRIGLILAGNLPMVGLHDLFMTLLSGHRAILKPSHKDAVLMRTFVAGLPEVLKSRVEFTNDIASGRIDFLLATGSDNTARYIAHEFEGLPKIIRRNRFSVAQLDGNESVEQLAGLAKDILDYHGMGCRSVCNILVPIGYAPAALLEALNTYPKSNLASVWHDVLRWETAMARMESREYAPCERIVLEAGDVLRPAKIGVLRIIEVEYDLWADLLEVADENLQCRIGGELDIDFGQAQSPDISDFADGLDVLDVLTNLD